MDPARFGGLGGRLEQRAQRQPRLYRAQVGALAAMGYLYVIGLLCCWRASSPGWCTRPPRSGAEERSSSSSWFR